MNVFDITFDVVLFHIFNKTVKYKMFISAAIVWNVVLGIYLKNGAFWIFYIVMFILVTLLQLDVIIYSIVNTCGDSAKVFSDEEIKYYDSKVRSAKYTASLFLMLILSLYGTLYIW